MPRDPAPVVIVLAARRIPRRAAEAVLGSRHDDLELHVLAHGSVAPFELAGVSAGRPTLVLLELDDPTPDMMEQLAALDAAIGDHAQRVVLTRQSAQVPLAMLQHLPDGSQWRPEPTDVLGIADTIERIVDDWLATACWPPPTVQMNMRVASASMPYLA